MRLTWLGHSSLKLETAQSMIYIDPYYGEDYKTASLILVSRIDFDHCSLQKIRKMMVENTVVIAHSSVASEIYPCKTIHPGETIKVKDVEVTGMPVLEKGGQEKNAVNFLILAEGKRIYYMADSYFEKEMEKAKPDVLLIAVGGTMTHGPETAAGIANRINPKLAVPIHWGSREGTYDNAALFKEYSKVPVKILKEGESLEI